MFQLTPYGSFVTKLQTPFSDIDLTIQGFENIENV